MTGRDFYMHWNHNNLVESTVASFVALELPDAHGWGDLPYQVMPVGSLDGVMRSGECWRVEADIPTSSMDAWLSFTLVISPGESEPVVRDIHCVRNGRDDGEKCYVWQDGEWSILHDEEDG